MKKILILILIILLSANLFSKDKKKDTLEVKTNEIVISAMRYPERLIEVPMAINLITSEDIKFSKGSGIDEALKMIPGVMSQSRNGSQDVRISIRGYGARGAGDRSNAGTSRGIKFFLDGIPETEPDGRTSYDMIDLSMASKIEVIRSNASAIWGNAAGGVISISTVPIFDRSFIQLDASGGSYGFQKYLFQTGTNLGSSKVYAQFSMNKSDGYRQNSGTEKYLLNIGMNSALSEKTLLSLHLIGVSSSFSIPGALTQEQFDATPEIANKAYADQRERRYNRIARIGVNLEHNFNIDNTIQTMAFVSPKFLQRSERNTFRDFTRYYLGASTSWRNTLHFSDNLKLTSLFGLDESYQDGAILFYKLANGERSDLKTDKTEGANSFGAYLQEEFNVNEKISILLGVRYDRMDYCNALYYENPDFFNSSQNKTFEYATPKAAISYRFTPEHSVYLSYGGGVEVPAGNETDPVSGDALVNPMLNDPIVSTTFELGTKQVMAFDRSVLKSLNYDLAGYFIETKNELIPYREGRFYIPTGKTNRMGIEAGLNVQFDYNLSVDVSFTYSNNKYKDYVIDSAIYSKVTTKNDYSNNKMAGLPDVYYYSALRYYNPEMLGALAEINIQGVGKYFADDANLYEVPSYSIFNAKVGIDFKAKLGTGFNLKLWLAANNLTDKRYAASSFINPLLSAGKPMYLEPGLPRNFVFGFSVGL